MEIIAKISKGTKMDQIYIQKQRAGFPIGNYVIIKPITEEKPIEKRKLYFRGLKEIEPIKIEIIEKIMNLIDKNIENDNIIITGSFLEKGFNFNDIDILIITKSKEKADNIEKETKEKIGIKPHIILFKAHTFKKALEIDPLWRLILYKCISRKRLPPMPKRKLDYKYLDVQLIRSKTLIDTFDILNGNEKYKLVRNLIAIYSFIKNKPITSLTIENEISDKFEISIKKLQDNIINKNFLKNYKNLYSILEKEVIENAGKQEKIN